jgi:tyrosine-protein kinase Etk/Wzc
MTMSNSVPETGDAGASNNSKIGNDEFSLIDLATVLAGNLRTLISLPLAASVLTFGASYLIPPTFTASTQILVPSQQQSGAAAMLGSLGGLSSLAGGALGGLKNPADQWVGLLKSRTVADAMLDRFKLVDRYETDYRFQARKMLEERTRFVAGKDGLIDIEIEDEDPKTAADMAGAYVEELRKLSNGLAVTEAAQRRLFFETQLRQIKDGLIKAEIALQSSGVNASVLKTDPGAAVAAVAQLKAQISATEVRLQVLQNRLNADAPEMREARMELASLKQMLNRAEQSDSHAGRGAGAEYVTRYREFKYQETLFELMARQFELAKADEAREGTIIQVVDAPQVPEWKTKPKRATLAVGAGAAALVLTVFVVLMRNAVANIKDDPTRASKWARLTGMLQRRRLDRLR